MERPKRDVGDHRIEKIEQARSSAGQRVFEDFLVCVHASTIMPRLTMNCENRRFRRRAHDIPGGSFHLRGIDSSAPRWRSKPPAKICLERIVRLQKRPYHQLRRRPHLKTTALAPEALLTMRREYQMLRVSVRVALQPGTCWNRHRRGYRSGPTAAKFDASFLASLFIGIADALFSVHGVNRSPDRHRAVSLVPETTAVVPATIPRRSFRGTLCQSPV